jgi:type IV pilus assembly protein PilV
MGADVVNDGNNQAGLTGVRGCISQVLNAVTVVVSWEGRTEIADAEKDNCGTAGAKRRQVIVKAFIN